MKLIPQKLDGWGLLFVENCMIVTSTVFDGCAGVTDRQTGTDRQ